MGDPNRVQIRYSFKAIVWVRLKVRPPLTVALLTAKCIFRRFHSMVSSLTSSQEVIY